MHKITLMVTGIRVTSPLVSSHLARLMPSQLLTLAAPERKSEYLSSLATDVSSLFGVLLYIQASETRLSVRLINYLYTRDARLMDPCLVKCTRVLRSMLLEASTNYGFRHSGNCRSLVSPLVPWYLL